MNPSAQQSMENSFRGGNRDEENGGESYIDAAAIANKMQGYFKGMFTWNENADPQDDPIEMSNQEFRTPQQNIANNANPAESSMDDDGLEDENPSGRPDLNRKRSMFGNSDKYSKTGQGQFNR